MNLSTPRRRLGIALWVLALLVSACQPKAPQGFGSAEALRRALREAGAAVERSDVAAPAPFAAASAQTWQVSDGLVFIYEFADESQVRDLTSGMDPEARTLAGRPLPWSDQLSLWASGRVLVAYEGTDGGLILLLSGLLGDPLTVPTEIPQDPYPPAVTAALLAWAESLGIDPAAVEVVGYAPAEWASSCLGLAEAGEACAGVITPGWVVELRSGDRTGTAHTDAVGLRVRLAPES
ncbi:MAG: hypothetical protein FJZ97_12640 [Chloroflexi bacterium]|nr:hypothetical protein [Chloroflexota bacterium]